MPQIGRKVYYELATGNVIVTTSEMSGLVRETTTEEDFEMYVGLSSRNPATVGVIQLEHGELSEEFNLATGYNVNLETGEIEFDLSPPDQEAIESLKTTEQKLQELQTNMAILQDTINFLLGLDG